MHGYNHLYDKETNKKDFFNYGGRSEFFGHSYEDQLSKIQINNIKNIFRKIDESDINGFIKAFLLQSENKN